MKKTKPTYEELLAENNAFKKQLADNEAANAPDSSNLLKLFIDSVPILVAYIDRAFRFKLANKHFKILHGLEPEEMIGKTVHDIIGDEGWAVEKDKYDKALSGEKIISIDKFTTKTGTFHWYQVSLVPHIVKEKVIGIFCLVIDLTEQKLLEHEIKENEKNLTLLNATKDKFFSIIAHDLNTPFNSILGLSYIIEASLKNDDFDSARHASELIKKASEKTQGLLQNLFEWSRSQRNQIKFNPESVDLAKTAREIVELMDYSAIQKEISIELNAPATAFFFVDKAMIETVLRNLTSNAIKFTDRKGKITINVNEDSYFSVSDTGIGMSENTTNKLFKINETISKSGTANEAGTGLGLILCYEFVKKHGGEISVESEVGVGSIFKVTLPKH